MDDDVWCWLELKWRNYDDPSKGAREKRPGSSPQQHSLHADDDDLARWGRREPLTHRSEAWPWLAQSSIQSPRKSSLHSLAASHLHYQRARTVNIKWLRNMWSNSPSFRFLKIDHRSLITLSSTRFLPREGSHDDYHYLALPFKLEWTPLACITRCRRVTGWMISQRTSSSFNRPFHSLSDCGHEWWRWWWVLELLWGLFVKKKEKKSKH